MGQQVGGQLPPGVVAQLLEGRHVRGRHVQRGEVGQAQQGLPLGIRVQGIRPGQGQGAVGQGQGADAGQVGPVHLRAVQRGIVQGLHGRQDAFPDLPRAFAQPGLGAGQGPGQGRVILEITDPVHPDIIHVPHMALPVHAHPKHATVGLVGMGHAVRQHGLGTDLPGHRQDRPEALGHGEQHLRLVPGQELHGGAVRLERRVHGTLLPRQVEGAGVVLRQVAVGPRRLGHGRGNLILGGDRDGTPQPPQAQQQRQQPSGPKAFARSPARQGLKAAQGFAHD